MDTYTVKDITNKKAWDKFVLSSGARSFLHSWNWGESNKVLGDEIFRLGYFNKTKLVGVCLLIKQKARRGPHFLVPGGPVIDWKNKKLVSTWLKSIKKLGKKEDVWFIRIRPEVLDSTDSQKLFKKMGMHPAQMHLNAENTWVLDITPNEEVLLANMRKSTRYLVRRGGTSDLKLEQTTDSKKCEILYNLQTETVARHKFVGFSLRTFTSQLTTFGADDQATLFICSYKKIPLAAAIIIFYGNTAYYHHSGSTLSHKEIPSMYFLQWEIIKEAKRRGIHYYNFWGIAPNNDPTHRFAGVTLFKTGFGGEKVDWLHAQDLPISRKYWLTYVFEALRKRARHL